MAAWFALAVGAVLPIVVMAAVVALRLRNMGRDRRAAEQQALRFAAGILLGVVARLLISAVVIGLVLLLRWVLGR